MRRVMRAGALIGGPEATSWPVLNLTMLLLLIDRLGTDLERTGRPLQLVTSAFVGSLTIVGVARMSRPMLTSTARGERNPLRTIVCLLLAGTSAAFTGRIHDRAVGLPVDESLAHIFQRAGWGFTVLLILTTCVTAISGHRTEIDALAARSAQLLRSKIEIDELLRTAVASELASVDAEIRAEIERLNDADFTSAIATLRHLGLRVVRERSHQLSIPDSPYRAPPPEVGPVTGGVAELLADITADRPIRPAFPAALLALWGTGFTLADSGPLGALMVGAAHAAIALIVWGTVGLVLDQVLPGRRLRTRVVLVVLAMFAAAAGWVAAAELWEHASGQMLPTAETLVQRVAQALTLTLFPIVQVLSRALWHRSELMLSSLQDQVDHIAAEVARANTELWAQRRLLARELHGPVQAVVNAATLRLLDAEQDGLPIEVTLRRARIDIENALAHLATVIAVDERSRPHDLDQAIGRICGLWEGLTDIEVEVSEEATARLDCDPTLRAALVEVLTEACSNAVRHGNAKLIRAATTLTERGLLLEVIDDGRPAESDTPGLGTSLLDEIALDWDRTHGDAGTRLGVTFA